MFLKREFPDLQVTIVAKGQGAAIGIITAAVGKKSSKFILFLMCKIQISNLFLIIILM